MYRFLSIVLFSNLIFSQSFFPDNKVQKMTNVNVSLHKLTSEITFVSFWATWCIPCIKEIDKLNEFIGDYKSVSVILVNEDRPGNKAKVKSFVRSKKYPISDTYHIVFDNNHKLSRQFNAQPIPLTLLLKNNKVVYRKRGFKLGDEIEIKRELQKIIDE